MDQGYSTTRTAFHVMYGRTPPSHLRPSDRPTCWSLFRLCENMSVGLVLFSTECRAICLTHSILPPFVTNVAPRDRSLVRKRGCVICFASPFKNSSGTPGWFGLPTWAGQMALALASSYLFPTRCEFGRLKLLLCRCGS